MADKTTNYQPVKDFDVEERFLPESRESRRGQLQDRPFPTWVTVLVTVFLTMMIILSLQVGYFLMLRPQTICTGGVAQKGFSTEWGKV